MFSFCLNSSRDRRVTTQKEFVFYCWVVVPHLSAGSHMGRGKKIEEEEQLGQVESVLSL